MNNYIGHFLDNGLAQALYGRNRLHRPVTSSNENIITDMADRMVTDGFLAAGYNRVHIDDCWMEKERDKAGRLVADHQRFPSGIKKLSKYMHDKGLQLGIYEDYGTETCEGYPGSLNHLQIDAETFASWDVDYLKLDGCNVNTTLMPIGYPKMERALNGTGRPIVYACGWPFFFYKAAMRKKDKINFTAVRAACNSWRIYEDVAGNWNSISDIIRFVNENQDMFAAAQGPGGWNDPDMLVVGLPNVTLDQAMVQMTIWSIWSAPLIMSNDFARLKQEFRDILLNRDVIAIDQDPLGIMGKLVRRIKYISIYVKPVTPVRDGNSSYAVAVVNMHVQKDKE
ncbi:alpha-galactosidase [Ostertagia ostertagi]